MTDPSFVQGPLHDIGLAKWRKKPAIIDAVMITHDNVQQVADWCNGTAVVEHDGVRVKDVAVLIPTLEGVMRGDEGDFIIRGVQGEFYPCKASIFLETYEKPE